MKRAERNEKGHKGEDAVADLLRWHGRKVEVMRPNHPFDLLVDGKWKVEVKTASPGKRRKGLQWRFEIMRHGVLNEVADFYILRLDQVPYTARAVHCLVIAPVMKTQIAISFRGLLDGDGYMAQAFQHFARTGNLLRTFSEIPWSEVEQKDIEAFDGVMASEEAAEFEPVEAEG
jgi:hypothetical protein